MFLSSWRENDAFSRAGRRAPIVLYDNIVPFEETIRTVVSTAKSGGVDGDATPDLAESIGKFSSISRQPATLSFPTVVSILKLEISVAIPRPI